MTMYLCSGSWKLLLLDNWKIDILLAFWSQDVNFLNYITSHFQNKVDNDRIGNAFSVYSGWSSSHSDDSFVGNTDLFQQGFSRNGVMLFAVHQIFLYMAQRCIYYL